MIRKFIFKLPLLQSKSSFCPSFCSAKIIPFSKILNFADSMKNNKNLVADKTHFIEKILAAKRIYLITRPRRMGKTFNLSMLQCFFDQDEKDAPEIFKDTYIASNQEILKAHMNKYPVISLSLKGNIIP